MVAPAEEEMERFARLLEAHNRTTQVNDPRAEMERFEKLMETYNRSARNNDHKRILGKDFSKDIQEFDGDEEKYFNWAFKMKIALKSESPKLLNVLEKIEKQENVVDLAELETKVWPDGKGGGETLSLAHGYEIVKMATELYDILGKKLDGHALTSLRNVEDFNGFEVWRILQKGCNPTSPVMLLRALVGLVVPKRSTSERTVSKDIDEWEVKVKKVVRDHGTQGELGMKLKIAIVTAMCPANMVETIYQHVTDQTTYEEFKKKVKALAETRIAVMSGTGMD